MRVLLIAALAACSSASKPPTPVEPPAPAERTPDAAPLEQAPAALDAGAAPGGLAADGAACLASTDCASGVCEGQGCSADQPGTCAPAQRGCTRDLRAYCGCDGVTFRTSGSCPRRRYASKGECPAGG